MCCNGFALKKWWNPKFKTKNPSKGWKICNFLVYFLAWELIIKETVTSADGELTLCQINKRTLSTRCHCIHVCTDEVCEGRHSAYFMPPNHTLTDVSARLSWNWVCFLSLGSELVLEIVFWNPLLSCPNILYNLFLVASFMILLFFHYTTMVSAHCVLYTKLSAFHTLSHSDPLE